MLPRTLEAAERLEEEDGVRAEVIDLLTISPLDDSRFTASARRTGRVVVVHEAPRSFGPAAEVVTRLVNHPQVAILGLARARLQPVVRGTLEDPDIVPRLLLPLSLGFDHRVIDGADAARFAGRIIEMLGDVESFALAV